MSSLVGEVPFRNPEHQNFQPHFWETEGIHFTVKTLS